MKKILLSIFTVLLLITVENAKAQCDLAFNNLVISPVGDPVVLSSTKCQYTFNASFDITTNSGFKYLFFHAWLLNEYPNPSIFDCGGNTPAADPGTAAQLGTAVDEPGKSFIDFGFIGLKDFLATNSATTPTDITSLIATTYLHDNTVALTQPSNSPGLSVKITKTGSVLHFDITNFRIVLNVPCGTTVMVKADIWGSNSNANDPKAQCYICGIAQTVDDPTITLIKLCNSSPFRYDIGISTASISNTHLVFRLYAHDPLGVGADALLFTSDTIIINNTNPFDPAPTILPGLFCCTDPFANWDIYVTVAGREFVNVISTPIISADCATLPVNLKLFTAVRTNNTTVNLKWETAQEENSKGFDIQRKLSNGAWQNIGYIDTKAPGGNSSSPLSYDFIDVNNTKGITQYRLRQLDISGKQSYSLIRSVRGEGQKGKTIIFPNPSSDGKVNVVFEDKNASREVSLLDMNGRMIRQWKNIMNNTLQIENLISGFYTLRIVNTETGEQAVEKFVVKNR